MEKKRRICDVLTWITGIICILSVVVPIVCWKYIPETIPHHFGALGEADAWSDKSSLILLFFFAILMFGIMMVLQYYMKTSLDSKNTSESEKSTYGQIYPMITVLNFVLQLMIAYIIFCSARAVNLGKYFLLIVLISTFVPMVYFIWKSVRTGGGRTADSTYLRQREEEERGQVYRTKIDWWLGLLLAGCIIYPAYELFRELIQEGELNWILLVTELFITALFIPMFRTRYILYEKHLLVICLGKERIKYSRITGMKETYNPLSSAALSLSRIQIDYKNENGGHEMILISPVRKKEFIKKIKEKQADFME